MTHALLINTEHIVYNMFCIDQYTLPCTLPVLKLHAFRVLLLIHTFVPHKDKLPNSFSLFRTKRLCSCMVLGMKQIYTKSMHHNMATAV